MYHGFHESGMEKDNLIQDLVIPMSQVSELARWVDEAFRVWPFWICPLRKRLKARSKQ